MDGYNSFKQRFWTFIFGQTRVPNRTCIFKDRLDYRAVNTHNVIYRNCFDRVCATVNEKAELLQR